MNTIGLWMLVALGFLTLTTGLPVWALLCGVSMAFAGFGIALGALDINALLPISGRILGLLENDLLQALPLYVLVGMLLQRLGIADDLFISLSRWFAPIGAARQLATMAVGAILAPMNGSIASSASMLTRLVSPNLVSSKLASKSSQKNEANRQVALVSTAATIGIVVPPSLVLILLGDAMFRAHTEASNLPGFSLGNSRIISTQDVFNAALLPAFLVLFLWTAIAWWMHRRDDKAQASTPPTPTPPTRARTSRCVIAIAVIVTLLGGVYLGKLFAVEAAAAGACCLIVAALLTKGFGRPTWAGLLNDTIQLSGALFALLVGATTFSMVFRSFGTDRWLIASISQLPMSAMTVALVILLFVATCAWVLDAFELIFVIIPIIAPLLIAKLGDPQQAAVLLLLVLQLSFLIPPMGYAVLIVRDKIATQSTSGSKILYALLPYIVAQVFVTIMVFMFPAVVHQLDAQKADAVRSTTLSDEEIEAKMRAMSGQK